MNMLKFKIKIDREKDFSKFVGKSFLVLSTDKVHKIIEVESSVYGHIFFHGGKYATIRGFFEKVLQGHYKFVDDVSV